MIEVGSDQGRQNAGSENRNQWQRRKPRPREKAGCDADVVVLDACAGGSRTTALDALANGDIAAVGAVVTDGVPRFVGRSRNTPAPMKKIRVVRNTVPQDYGLSAH